MKLFFDTETTGKANFRLPPEHHSQPRLVQLAAVLTDEPGNEICTCNLLVAPDGFEIAAEAAAIHGITTERAVAFGIPAKAAVAIFVNLARKAASIHAFNIEFDRIIMLNEILRIDKMPNPFIDRTQICEMLSMKNHCQLPGKYGDYKWPNLTETHTKATGSGFDKAHDALADVRAMITVHRWRLAEEARLAESPKAQE